eukprot:160688_1
MMSTDRYIKLLVNESNKEWEFDKKWLLHNNKNDKTKPKSLCIENALVSIIGISQYDKLEDDLPGVAEDVQKQIDLWNGHFGFDVNVLAPIPKPVSVVYGYCRQNISEKIRFKERAVINIIIHFYAYQPICKEHIDSFMFQYAKTPLINKKYDALIFTVSGHGRNDGLVTSNSKYYSIDSLRDSFNLESERQLMQKNMPKLFIIDICRGGKIANEVEIPEENWARWRGHGPTTIHPDSDTNTFWSNTKGYQVPEGNFDGEGGAFITNFVDIMKDTNLCNYDMSHIATLITERISQQTHLICPEYISRNKYIIFFQAKTGVKGVVDWCLETINKKQKDENVAVEMGDEADGYAGATYDNGRKGKNIKDIWLKWWTWFTVTHKIETYAVLSFFALYALVQLYAWKRSEEEGYEIKNPFTFTTDFLVLIWNGIKPFLLKLGDKLA